MLRGQSIPLVNQSWGVSASGESMSGDQVWSENQPPVTNQTGEAKGRGAGKTVYQSVCRWKLHRDRSDSLPAFVRGLSHGTDPDSFRTKEGKEILPLSRPSGGASYESTLTVQHPSP